MRVVALTVLSILSGCTFIYAQDKTQELKITGNPIITVFANYHAGIGSNNDISGFELTRAYLGYQFTLTSTLSGKAVLDAAVSSNESFMVNQERKVYLKNALLSWKDKGFTVNGGLIGLLQFNLQEKFWGYRYIAPSFQDLYKMGSSADLGITGEYKFSPLISADLSLTNGEGYKNMNKDNKYRYGAGITVNPIPSLTLRVYGDISQQSSADEDQKTLALFAGYTCNYFSLGAEYNYQQNNAWKADKDYYGCSVYTTVPIHDKWKIFGRYDYIDSKDENDDPWSSFTGDMVIAGIEYKPIKNLRIAPNYKFVKDTDTESFTKGSHHTAYLNVEFNW